MSPFELLQAEVIALRTMVARGLRSEFDAAERDKAWASNLRSELLQTIANLNLRGVSDVNVVKNMALEIIDEALAKRRPPVE